MVAMKCKGCGWQQNPSRGLSRDIGAAINHMWTFRSFLHVVEPL